jgi:hypothetical protein
MAETLDMFQTFANRLFWTADGRLGIGQSNIARKDKIAFLEGLFTQLSATWD